MSVPVPGTKPVFNGVMTSNNKLYQPKTTDDTFSSVSLFGESLSNSIKSAADTVLSGASLYFDILEAKNASKKRADVTQTTTNPQNEPNLTVGGMSQQTTSILIVAGLAVASFAVIMLARK